MSTRNYWSYVLGGDSWRELLAQDDRRAGFPRMSRNLQMIEPRHYLLCYQRREGRIAPCWVGVLEVVSTVFEDHTPIWRDGEYPWRFKVEAIVALTPETGVPIHQLRGQLTTQGIQEGWFFRDYPRVIPETDGEVVVNALQEARRRLTE